MFIFQCQETTWRFHFWSQKWIWSFDVVNLNNFGIFRVGLFSKKVGMFHQHDRFKFKGTVGKEKKTLAIAGPNGKPITTPSCFLISNSMDNMMELKIILNNLNNSANRISCCLPYSTEHINFAQTLTFS